MKTQKTLSLILSVLLLSTPLLAPLTTAADFNAASAQTYLSAHANNPWSTMALVALGSSSPPSDYLKNVSGSSAIEFEAPILAITSINRDPRTFGAANLVNKLESFHNNGQMGDPSALNDDIFGILALAAAGQPLTDTAIADSKSFLLGHQNGDGGWGFTITSGSDSNSTASAIVALVAAGVNSSDSQIQSALAYLKTAQNDDGGFTYDPKSPLGTSSDSSSTAWVLWALNALKIDESSWSKSGHEPASYLQGNQASNGYFKYQANSAEDAFSSVTTAYAVIALSGKTLPLNIFTSASGGASPPTDTFAYRIEGSQNTVCEGAAAGPTALDIVKNASVQCGFTYHIKDTSFGPYLDQIGSDTASGLTGWLYRVNFIAPDAGAADYQLKPGDEVLWYFGNFDWQPTRLTLDKTKIGGGQSALASVEVFSSSSWSSLSGAIVSVGTQTFTTDASGHAGITNQDGFYKVFAAKDGFVRSNKIFLQIGQPSSSSVNLTASVSAGSVQGTSSQPSTISFTVDQNSLDFGTLAPGSSAVKQLNIKNQGSAGLHIESMASGDSLFTDDLQLNDMAWQNFSADLTGGQSQAENVKLTVPPGYSLSGQKNGQLVFWAMAE